MTGPDILDDTTDDYERLETELVAQDQDTARVSTADSTSGVPAVSLMNL